MEQLHTLIDNVLDTSGRKIQCSPDKGKSSVYLPVEEAKNMPFIRFGNQHFIPAISIDIDTHQNPRIVSEIIKQNGLPTPNLLVYTSKGLHIHWILEHVVPTKSYAALKLYQMIADELIKAFDSDKNAMPKQSGRMFRNPLKHKTVIFTDKKHTLDDFKHIIKEPDEKTMEIRREKMKLRYQVPDFGTISEGARNNTLFDYGRYIAYAKGNVKNLDAILMAALEKANAQFSKRLPVQEVARIVQSIVRFIVHRYSKHTRNKRTIEFNRNLAKKQYELKQNELLKKWVGLGIVPLKALKTMSDRAGGRLFGISKNTYKKHKAELIKIIKNLPILFKKLIKFAKAEGIETAMPIIKALHKPTVIHCNSPPMAA